MFWARKRTLPALTAIVTAMLAGCSATVGEEAAPLSIDEACDRFTLATDDFAGSTGNITGTSASLSEASEAMSFYGDELQALADSLQGTDRLLSQRFAALADSMGEGSEDAQRVADGDLSPDDASVPDGDAITGLAATCSESQG